MTSIDKYREILAKHAAKQGLIMNPDRAEVDPLLEGLLQNGERYGLRTCPCRPATGERSKDLDIVCPCVYARPDVDEYGACYCDLFVSEGRARGEAPKRQVPERRPAARNLDV